MNIDLLTSETFINTLKISQNLEKIVLHTYSHILTYVSIEVNNNDVKFSHLQPLKAIYSNVPPFTSIYCHLQLFSSIYSPLQPHIDMYSYLLPGYITFFVYSLLVAISVE